MMYWCPKLLIVVLVFAQAGCQTTSISDQEETLPAGYRPDSSTDEGGIWMVFDKAEEELKTSGQVIRSPDIQAYLQRILCKLDPVVCTDIRIYIVKLPYFNASMAPNGVMQVWTGLLLRVQNEAQLAYILGHELGHYMKRHSLERFRQVKNTSGFLSTFQLALGAAGAGQYGNLATLMGQGMVLKFSRDHEREADDSGFQMIVAVGYDPREAPKVWANLLAEREAMEESGTFVFLSTHPQSEERTSNLTTKANRVVASRDGWTKGAQQLGEAVAPIRFELLREELRLRKYAATQVLLDRFRKDGWNLGLIEFFQGELYRLRGEKADLELARHAYEKSLGYSEAPAEAYRELGLIYYRKENYDKVVPLLNRYLEAVPDAFDRPMIESYIGESERGTK